MHRVGATRLERLGRPARGSTRIDVMFAIIVTLTNVFEIAITLFGIWHNKMFDFNSHQWCVNLPRGARQPAPYAGQVDEQVKRCHITYNTQNTTILLICFNA